MTVDDWAAKVSPKTGGQGNSDDWISGIDRKASIPAGYNPEEDYPKPSIDTNEYSSEIERMSASYGNIMGNISIDPYFKRRNFKQMTDRLREISGTAQRFDGGQAIPGLNRLYFELDKAIDSLAPDAEKSAKYIESGIKHSKRQDMAGAISGIIPEVLISLATKKPGPGLWNGVSSAVVEGVAGEAANLAGSEVGRLGYEGVTGFDRQEYNRKINEMKGNPSWDSFNADFERFKTGGTIVNPWQSMTDDQKNFYINELPIPDVGTNKSNQAEIKDMATAYGMLWGPEKKQAFLDHVAEQRKLYNKESREVYRTVSADITPMPGDDRPDDKYSFNEQAGIGVGAEIASRALGWGFKRFDKLGAAAQFARLAEDVPGRTTGSEIVEKAVSGADEVLSKEAVESATKRGLTVPYPGRFMPNIKTSEMIGKALEQNNSPLSRFMQNNAKLLKDLQVNDRKNLFDMVDRISATKGYGEASKLTAKLTRAFGDDVANSIVPKIQLSELGVPMGEADKMLAKLKKRASLAQLTKTEIKEATKSLAFRDVAKVEKEAIVKNITDIVTESAENKKVMNSLRWDSLHQAMGDKKFPIEDLSGRINEAIGDLIPAESKLIPEGGGLTKLRADMENLGVSADEALSIMEDASKGDPWETQKKLIAMLIERGVDPSEAVGQSQKIMMGSILTNVENASTFSELHKVASAFSKTFPAHNRTLGKAYNNVRTVLYDKLSEMAESEGLGEEFKLAREATADWYKRVDAPIYKQISKNPRVMDAFVGSLMKNEGDFKEVLYWAKEAGKEKELATAFRQKFARSIYKGGDPKELVEDYYSGVRKYVKKDSAKVQNEVKRLFRDGERRIKEGEKFGEIADDFKASIDSIKSMDKKTKNDIISVFGKLIDVHGVGTFYNPAAIARNMQDQLDLNTIGRSPIVEMLGEPTVIGQREFARGAEAAVGMPFMKAVGGSADMQTKGENLAKYFAYTGNVSSFAYAMGMLGVVTGRTKTIGEALVNPANAKNLRLTPASQAAHTAMKRMIRTAFVEDGRRMTAEEETELNNLIKTLGTKDQPRVVAE